MSQVQQTENKSQEVKVSVEMTKEQKEVWNGLVSYINKKLAVKKAKSGGGGTSKGTSSEELKTLRTHVKNVDKLVQRTMKIQDPAEKQKAIDGAFTALRGKMSKVSGKGDKDIDYYMVVGVLKTSAELASYLPKPVSTRKKPEQKTPESKTPPTN